MRLFRFSPTKRRHTASEHHKRFSNYPTQLVRRAPAEPAGTTVTEKQWFCKDLEVGPDLLFAGATRIARFQNSNQRLSRREYEGVD